MPKEVKAAAVESAYVTVLRPRGQLRALPISRAGPSELIGSKLGETTGTPNCKLHWLPSRRLSAIITHRTPCPTSSAMAAEAYAREWIDAWNSLNLKRILSHYAEDVVFKSPRVQVRRVDGQFWQGAPTAPPPSQYLPHLRCQAAHQRSGGTLGAPDGVLRGTTQLLPYFSGGSMASRLDATLPTCSMQHVTCCISSVSHHQW